MNDNTMNTGNPIGKWDVNKPDSVKGWECPKCGAVMSPYTSTCYNCKGNVTYPSYPQWPNIPYYPNYHWPWNPNYPIVIC